MKKVFITGITGQTGSYLAEQLLESGYEVHGLLRRSSSIKTDRIDKHFKDYHLHYGDMTDGMGLVNVMEKIKPDYVYNLAAQSHVKVSFEMPEYTMDTDATGTLRLLEIIRTRMPATRFYQASTSEMFGSSPAPQNENTIFQPCSPYGAAKLSAYWMVRNYREAYGLFAVNGILFNHESPRRGETFVTRKITKWVARYKKLGLDATGPLELGNVWAIRDWSHAIDMARGIQTMMEHDRPDDYVLGSGKGYTVKDFIDITFKCANLKPVEWIGEKNQPVQGYHNGKLAIQSVDKYYRPLEVNELIADTTRAKSILQWYPMYNLEKLIEDMLKHDMDDL